jgi:hypothetical protein
LSDFPHGDAVAGAGEAPCQYGRPVGASRRVAYHFSKSLAANLDAANAPAITRVHAPADEIAAAIIVVIVIIIRVAAVIVWPEAKSDKAAPVESTAMKAAAAVETTKAAAMHAAPAPAPVAASTSTVAAATAAVCESAG